MVRDYRYTYAVQRRHKGFLFAGWFRLEPIAIYPI
jgi:hypothetical protein